MQHWLPNLFRSIMIFFTLRDICKNDLGIKNGAQSLNKIGMAQTRNDVGLTSRRC